MEALDSEVVDVKEDDARVCDHLSVCVSFVLDVLHDDVPLSDTLVVRETLELNVRLPLVVQDMLSCSD
jgi:hypothetical protein